MALEFYELYDGDELAATRRAIVRAAAEIGKLQSSSGTASLRSRWAAWHY